MILVCRNNHHKALGITFLIWFHLNLVMCLGGIFRIRDRSLFKTKSDASRSYIGLLHSVYIYIGLLTFGVLTGQAF